MVSLGLGNNIMPKMEDVKKSSTPTTTRSFSSSSNRVKENTLANSSSSLQNKSLEENSEFSKKVEDATTSEDKKYTYSKANYTKSESNRDQIKVNKDDISEEQATTLANDYSKIVPIYSQNEFFAPQAPIPVQSTNYSESIEEKTLRLLNPNNVSTENQPVVKFMKELYQKLGIAPEKLVSAFQQLPMETLMQSPKQAMDALFQKLDLQPGDYTKAQILFNEMIDGIERQVDNIEHKQLQLKPSIAEQLKKQNQNLDVISNLKPVEAQAMPAGTQSSPMPVAANVKSTLEQMLQERLLQSNTLSTAPVQQIGFTTPTQLASVAQVSNPVFDAAMLTSMDRDLELVELGDSEQTLENTLLQQDSELANILKTLSENADNEQNSEHQDELAKMLGLHELKSQNLSKGDFATKLTMEVDPKSGKLNPENIESMVSNAQSIVQKGGGEMKIALRPDGLGEIHLKIQVADGKVGLQMITESQDAKKLLEGSMQELKLALTEHKLSLNDIKVDVSQKMSQEMLQQDARREDAREFLGQFRQFNEGFKQAFGDTSGAVRQYRSNSRPMGSNIDPIEVKERKNSNGRIHLVA